MSSIAPRNSPISSSHVDLTQFPEIPEKAPGTDRTPLENVFWLALSLEAPGAEQERKENNRCMHTYD